jgi:tetratricopeptide (TPR) repeat protein
LSAITIRKQLTADFPNVPEYIFALGGNYCNLGNLHRATGNQEKSLPWYDLAIETLKPVVQQDVQAKKFLFNSHYARARALMELKEHEKTIKDWDRALELDPSSVPARIRRALCQAYFDPHAAVSEAEKMYQADTPTFDLLYGAAKVYALSSNHDKVKDRREELAARAISALQRLLERGLFKNPTHINNFKKDPCFDSMRHRDDFKLLQTKLETPPR